jgi:hypothetical protein
VVFKLSESFRLIGHCCETLKTVIASAARQSTTIDL